MCPPSTAIHVHAVRAVSVYKFFHGLGELQTIYIYKPWQEKLQTIKKKNNYIPTNNEHKEKQPYQLMSNQFLLNSNDLG